MAAIPNRTKPIAEVKYRECNECPHANNSTLEHNCAFTSAPYPPVQVYAINVEGRATAAAAHENITYRRWEYPCVGPELHN